MTYLTDRASLARAYLAGELDAAGREATERLLETDVELGAAMLRAAERLGMAGGSGDRGDGWEAVAHALAAMPHLGATGVPPAPAQRSASRAMRFWLRFRALMRRGGRRKAASD